MRSDRRLIIILSFVLIVTTLLVFCPCFSFDFLLTWDDGWQVFNDNTHDGLTIQNVGKMFSSFYQGQYSPLNQFIYTCVKLCLIAFLTSICMVIHPLQVEPVSWISTSKILSCSFFFLSGLVVNTCYASEPIIRATLAQSF